MNTLTAIVIVAVIVLAFAAFITWRNWNSKRRPLGVYVIGVAVVWAVILGVMWFTGDRARFQTFALIYAGVAIGMLAMYIAMHVYKS